MIKFDANKHEYHMGTNQVPSVTQIIREVVFPNQYADIPKYILENAAKFGNAVHEAVETDRYENLSQLEKHSYNEWLKIRYSHNIKPLHHEMIVGFKSLYAGTLDMIAELNGNLVLLDVKTTYELNEEYLSWQLTMYKMAYESLHEAKLQKGYVVWLPKKRLGELREIAYKDELEVYRVLHEYYERRNYENI